MNTIFMDSSLAEQIRQQGFAKREVLNAQDILEIKELYRSLGEVNRKGTHVTMFNPSSDYRQRVDEGIKKICADKVTALMIGYSALYANFMVKESGEEGDFPLHQDWTYVDEGRFVSIAVWIPLEEVKESKGALHVVRGSHKFPTGLRGPYVHEPFSEIGKEIRENFSTCVDLKAGEALLWDHRLLHFSKPNLTPAPRLAITLIMLPTEAEAIHCFAKPESKGTQIEKYAVDRDFYMHYIISERPTGFRLIETVDQAITTITKDDFEQMYEQANKR